MMRTLNLKILGATILLGFALPAGTGHAQDKAKIDHGIKVYAAQKCQQCHSIEGKPATATAKKGPLDGVGDKLSDDEIRSWLVEPKAMATKTKSTRKPVMKDYSKLPKEDIDALVAYMKSLKKK